MALQTSDLFYVQRPAGGDAGNYKMQAGDLVDFIAGSSGSLTYRGTVNCTQPVGTQLEQNPPLAGDIYINTGTGNVDGSGSNSTNAWVGIQGQSIESGQRIVFDGTSWEIVGAEAGGGVESIQGVAPIQVNDADDANPIISIDQATKAAFGSTRLAQDPPNGGNLSSTATTDVLSVPHFNELAGRISTAAGGGVQSVSANNGLTATGTSDVTVSGVNATTGVKGVVQLTDSVADNSTLAVTGKAVRGYAVPLNINSLAALP